MVCAQRRRPQLVWYIDMRRGWVRTADPRVNRSLSATTTHRDDQDGDNNDIDNSETLLLATNDSKIEQARTPSGPYRSKGQQLESEATGRAQ